MGAQVENNFVRVLYSSPSSNLPYPLTFKVLLQRSCASVCNDEGTTTLFEVEPKDDNTRSGKVYSLTAALIQNVSGSTLEDILESCETFIWNANYASGHSITALVEGVYDGKDEPARSRRAHLIILNKLERSTSQENVLRASKELQTQREVVLDTHTTLNTRTPNPWRNWKFQLPKSHAYESLPGSEIVKQSGLQHRRRLVTTSILSFALLLIASLSFLAILRAKGDQTYIRYDTSGSSGPRHQLRVYWQNASEWAKANPQDSGKWKVRIDDQAIIPAELYDADEDRYQQWYRDRYPEAQQVVEDLNYVRPAWLGSLDMMVPWDDQFHFAHCVLALRRYWKAKETGKHVCGRDIDHAHINHCLDALEERIFTEGPRVEMDPPQFLYWQTRVCF